MTFKRRQITRPLGKGYLVERDLALKMVLPSGASIESFSSPREDVDEAFREAILETGLELGSEPVLAEPTIKNEPVFDANGQEIYSGTFLEYVTPVLFWVDRSELTSDEEAEVRERISVDWHSVDISTVEDSLTDILEKLVDHGIPKFSSFPLTAGDGKSYRVVVTVKEA